MCPTSRRSLPAAPSLPAALHRVLRPVHHCIHLMRVLGRYSKEQAAAVGARSWCQGKEWLLRLSATRGLEKPLLGLWELGNTRNRHCSIPQGKEIRLHSPTPETHWRKLLLGCVSCMGFNPKHTVKSKQERWQTATSPPLSALFVKDILSTALAALRKEEQCGAWEAICWYALRALEVWGTGRRRRELRDSALDKARYVPEHHCLVLAYAEMNPYPDVCWSRVSVLVLWGFFSSLSLFFVGFGGRFLLQH